jgi:hypothetical protein
VRIAGGTTEMQKKNVFMSLMDSAPLAVPAGPARENRTDTTAVRLQRHGSAPTAA